MARRRKREDAKETGVRAAERSASAVFKAIDDKMWKPGGGCSSHLDYMEQSSWLLFLRYLDAREEDRLAEAKLLGTHYEPALPEPLAGLHGPGQSRHPATSTTRTPSPARS